MNDFISQIPAKLLSKSTKFIIIIIIIIIAFPVALRPLFGSWPSHYRGFTITLRHTTLGRTPLDE
jgi:hypothetical protein